MSPMAKMPGSLVSNAAVSTAIRSFSRLSPQSGDRAQLHLQAIEGEQRVALDAAGTAVPALDLHGLQPLALALEPGDLADDQLHAALGHEVAHLLDRVGSGPELVAAMHQRHRAGDRLQVEHPVERGVAAAGDQDPPAAELLHLAHGVEQRRALEPLRTWQGQPARHEAAGTGGDHHDRRLDHGAEIGLQPPAPVRQPLQRGGLLLEVEAAARTA